MHTTTSASLEAGPEDNHKHTQELPSRRANPVPTLSDSQEGNIQSPPMKNLDDFVFLKKDPSYGMFIWNFSAQAFVVWDPIQHKDHARDLLWRGVLTIFKALYLGTHACSVEDIRKWAPDEYVHKAFAKKVWDAKVRTNHSLYHSYILKTGVTDNILKRWQLLNGYPTRASRQSQNSEEADDAKEERLSWFLCQAESDKDALLYFTKHCSEAVNWNLVFERNSTEASRSYNWITYSLACAVDIVFGLALDEPGEGDTRKICQNRNKIWEAMVEEGTDHYKSFPLEAIFWPKILSADEFQGSQDLGNDLNAVSTMSDSQPHKIGTIQGATPPKRTRQPTQKAQELSEHATTKRPKKKSNDTFISEKSQQITSEITESHDRIRAQPAVMPAVLNASPARQVSRTTKTVGHLVDNDLAQKLTSRESSITNRGTSTVSAPTVEVPQTPSPITHKPNAVHSVTANNGNFYKVPINPTITIAQVANWDTEAAIEHLRSAQVNEDDIVTISSQEYIGVDANMEDEIQLPFSGHILWYLHKADIYDPNMYYEEPHRLWAAITETRALARRQSRVLEKRALRALGEWEGDSDEDWDEAEKDKGFFPEGEEEDEITKDRKRMERENGRG